MVYFRCIMFYLFMIDSFTYHILIYIYIYFFNCNCDTNKNTVKFSSEILIKQYVVYISM